MSNFVTCEITVTGGDHTNERDFRYAYREASGDEITIFENFSQGFRFELENVSDDNEYSILMNTETSLLEISFDEHSLEEDAQAFRETIEIDIEVMHHA